MGEAFSRFPGVTWNYWMVWFVESEHDINHVAFRFSAHVNTYLAQCVGRGSPLTSLKHQMREQILK